MHISLITIIEQIPARFKLFRLASSPSAAIYGGYLQDEQVAIFIYDRVVKVRFYRMIPQANMKKPAIVPHRNLEEGPAKINYYKNGEVAAQQFFLNGKRVSTSGKPLKKNHLRKARKIYRATLNYEDLSILNLDD